MTQGNPRACSQCPYSGCSGSDYYSSREKGVQEDLASQQRSNIFKRACVPHLVLTPGFLRRYEPWNCWPITGREKVRRQSQKQPPYLAQNFNSFNSFNICFIEPLLCAAFFPDTKTHPHQFRSQLVTTIRRIQALDPGHLKPALYCLRAELLPFMFMAVPFSLTLREGRV